jgi:LDH2 family malate/lactate/ureidoglycolate dehydrogenase
MTEEDADAVGKVVTHSDFTGVYSHGLSRITLYLRQLSNGSLNPRPVIKKLVDDNAVMAFDCDNGSGILAVNKVYDEVLKKAREYGIAIGTGMHGANIGCGAYYGWRAAEDDVIGIVCCNTFASMAPYGGADCLIGTNPIVISVPTGEAYPMVLDMSTSGVAFGKIQAYAREGKQLPPGWANDIDGKPTTDSSAAYTVLPIAQHKGYGLAVMVDILSAVLAKASYGTDIGLVSKLEPENTGFCVIIIDPSKFMPIEEFKKSADSYARMMKYSRPAEGVKEIFLPGEIEYRKFEEQKEKGFEVSEALGKELSELAAGLGLVSEGDTFEKLVKSV